MSSLAPSKTENLTPRDRLIVALDVKTRADAMTLVNHLSGRVGMFKVGSQLFTAAGPDLVREIVAEGHKIFLDLKYHDIPSTVASACIEAARLGATLLTLHSSGGEAMLRTASQAVREFCQEHVQEQPKLLAVTVLTSFGISDLKTIFVRDRLETVVTGLAELAARAGMDGVVTSPHEAMLVRHKVDRKSFVIVTPGIRPPWAAPLDQRRVLGPREALQEGADYIVVGRPIIGAPDPAEAAARVVEEIRAYTIESRNEEFRRHFQ